MKKFPIDIGPVSIVRVIDTYFLGTGLLGFAFQVPKVMKLVSYKKLDYYSSTQLICRAMILSTSNSSTIESKLFVRFMKHLRELQMLLDDARRNDRY